MEITRTEEVTRIYCDVCGDEVTHKNHRTEGGDRHTDYIVCLESNKFTVEMDKGAMVDIKPLSCQTLARLYTKYPELANSTFLKTFPVSDPR